MKKEQHLNTEKVVAWHIELCVFPLQLPRASSVRNFVPKEGFGQPVRGFGQTRPFSLRGIAGLL